MFDYTAPADLLPRALTLATGIATWPDWWGFKMEAYDATNADRYLLRFGPDEELVEALVLKAGAKGEARTLDGLTMAFGRASTIVQSTSATMDPEAARPFAEGLPWEMLIPGTTCMDLVYAPLDTTFLARARAAGANGIDGLGMLLHQGALAFERWTGKRPPLEVMREALYEESYSGAGPAGTTSSDPSTSS